MVCNLHTRNFLYQIGIKVSFLFQLSLIAVINYQNITLLNRYLQKLFFFLKIISKKRGELVS